MRWRLKNLGFGLATLRLRRDVTAVYKSHIRRITTSEEKVAFKLKDNAGVRTNVWKLAWIKVEMEIKRRFLTNAAVTFSS